jgi:RNA polymerase sigma-70 factor, ECF subfamily
VLAVFLLPIKRQVPVAIKASFVMTHSMDIDNLSEPYQAMRQALLGFLRKHVNDPATAEDILQDVFLKALIAGKRGVSPKNLSGWLYKIARNSIIDYYRSKRPSETLPADLIQVEIGVNETERNLAGCVRQLTDRLPPIYRDTLLATDFQGEPMADLASENNTSLSAIKSRASRARKMLKEKLLACCQIEVSKTGSVIEYTKRDSSCGDACSPEVNCKSGENGSRK